MTSMAQKHRIISGYSHLNLPPECWTGRVPAKWQDRVPRRVKLPNGRDAVLIEDWPLHTIGHTRVNGRSYDQHGIAPSVYDGPGTGSPEQRMREQDQNGVDAEVLYTDPYSPVFLAMVASQDSVGGEMMCAHPVFAGFWRGVREDEGYRALIRAYNEFLAEEYCAANPSRLIAMGIIPDTSVDDAIAEMEYCARAGLKGVALHRFPSGRGYPTRADNRFWQAARDMNVPITFHTHGGRTTFRPEGPRLQDPGRPADSPGERDPVSLLPRFAGGHPIVTPLQMAYAKVFDRFPHLRIYCAGSRAGWLPYSLCQIDDMYERNRYGRERCYGTEPMAHPPSFYLKTNCLWGFISDPHAVRMQHDAGVDHLIWGSDFAHATGGWPRSLDMIDRCFAGVPEEERYRMLAGNVIEFFHLKGEVVESAPAALAHAQ